MLRSARLGGALAVVAATLAAFLFASSFQAPDAVRISGGDALGRRHTVAVKLAELCRARGSNLEPVPTGGSEEALAKVQSGTLDAALVQGGLAAGHHVREVASLVPEPLHLLARGDITDVRGLRGKRVSTGTVGSGTHLLVGRVLAFVGLRPGHDFTEVDVAYRELETMPAERLPDAVFLVSMLPSPVADMLVRRHGYHLVAMPFGEAFALRDPATQTTVIPAFTYSVLPAIPERETPTLATRLLLVARDTVDADTVRDMVEEVYGDRFAHAVGIPLVDERGLIAPQYPLHRATSAFLRRNDPVVTPDTVEWLENSRSFLFALAVALWLGLRWWRSRRLRSIDTYLAEVTALEREALEIEAAATLDLPRLLKIRQRLGQLKSDAIDRFAHGLVRSGETLGALLMHVSDVRAYLNALILHERDRLEDEAQRAEPEARREALESLWKSAIGDYDPGPPFTD